MSYIFLTSPKVPQHVLEIYISDQREKDIQLFSPLLYQAELPSALRRGLIDGASELWVLGYTGWKSDPKVQADIDSYRRLWGAWRPLWVVINWNPGHHNRILYQNVNLA